jgi:hypothetical protein
MLKNGDGWDNEEGVTCLIFGPVVACHRHDGPSLIQDHLAGARLPLLDLRKRPSLIAGALELGEPRFDRLFSPHRAAFAYVDGRWELAGLHKPPDMIGMKQNPPRSEAGIRIELALAAGRRVDDRQLRKLPSVCPWEFPWWPSMRASAQQL